MNHQPSPLRIGVLGPNECSREEARLGYAVGAEIARRGGIVLCGGLDGMMAAAAEGAKSAKGTTVGLLPGDNASAANPFIDIPIPTGLGPLRNAVLVRACDAVIAIRGGHGTLTEIAFALRLGVPVVGLATWDLRRDGKAEPLLRVAARPEEAVALAFSLAERH
jgi:uncharacterized protein (TIGR00725 family)